ncbi:hypothetical protein A3K87_20645 [Variovorax paradoxus]|uniref:Uncharacterized protein n=1 Tax=Variovorax paradoxus TaxID=34073 RepID=A0AA91DLS4_VARPD|nr:hypothetical protein [Variovorax paradoxus]OAK61698.1 hypothetical protein A3K87_20645 [Variovorax paradoxus]
MLKIGGDHTQAGTGKVVQYTVEYDLDGNTGHWRGSILLRGGKRHMLAGGVLANVTRDTIGHAVMAARDVEIDGLDLEALNQAHGN